MSHGHTLALASKDDKEVQLRCTRCGNNAIFDLTGTREPQVKMVDGNPDIADGEIVKWMGTCQKASDE